MTRKFGLAICYLAVTSLVGGCRCSPEQSPSGETLTVSPEAKLIARGKLVYNAHCISCHNRNPKLPGSLGPEVYGSSKELLTYRLMKAEYPKGYRPKRESSLMPALPQLVGDIDALQFFLNAP